MEALLNHMRYEAERVANNRAKTRLGTVSSYDGKGAVKVILQPDGTETGFIPLGTLAVGNGWGMFFAPLGGEQVVVEFQEDAPEAPIATLAIYDNKNLSMAVPGGEWWLVHKSGSYIKFTADGLLHLNAPATINVGNEGNSLLSLVTQAFETLFNAHVHTNGNGGSNTGAPTMPMTSVHLTSVLKAN